MASLALCGPAADNDSGFNFWKGQEFARAAMAARQLLLLLSFAAVKGSAEYAYYGYYTSSGCDGSPSVEIQYTVGECSCYSLIANAACTSLIANGPGFSVLKSVPRFAKIRIQMDRVGQLVYW